MNEIINKLQTLKFSDYEAKVFISLYKGYIMSAAEIAKEAKIPRPSVYEILKSFSKKGYCNEIDTNKKLMFEMIDPQIIADKMQIELDKEYKQKTNSLKTCFQDLKPFHRINQPSGYNVDVELIRGFNKHREQKFMELVKNAKSAILVMNRFKAYVNPELSDESIKFHKRGGVVKSIYETNTKFKIKINNKWEYVTHEGLIKLCEEFTKQGEQVKLLEEVPQVMAVIDEQIVYFSLYDENIKPEDMSDVVIKNKRFAAFITNLFNLYWDKADTLDKFKKLFNNKKKIH